MEPLNDLPESVREIAELIGRESALTLIKRLPKTAHGRHIAKPIMYVPKTMSLSNTWACFYLTTLGWDKAMRLIRNFGGEILYPANCKQFEARQRDRDIRSCLQAGEDVDLIATIFNVPRRHVLKLLREISPDEKVPEEINAEGINHARCD